MKYLQIIITLIKSLFCTTNTPKNEELKPLFLVAPEHSYSLAFELGGKKFYCFDDEFKIPAGRALVALDVYEELNCKVDRLYLETLFESLVTLMNKGDLVQSAKLVGMAQARMANITNVDLLYKLASVRFFSDGENPYETSMQEVEKKIKFFKENSESVDAFFLRIPMAEFLPYGGLSDTNLQDYSEVQAKELSQMLELHLSILSDNPNAKDLLTKLQSQIEAIRQSKN
jgi:hypothetical protein